MRLFCVVMAITFAVASVTGCATIPSQALAMNPQTLEDRQLQTRGFSTTDEASILSACAGLMQDLGYSLDNSETKLGLIVGSKDREAVQAGQVIAASLLAALGGTTPIYDQNQRIRLSIVTRTRDGRTFVRATFQRIVWNNLGQVGRLERINDEDIYVDFFQQLSKAVFLEAQEI